MLKKTMNTVIAALILASVCFFASCSSKNAKADVVVIGAGGAGLSAALAAKEAGASVIIVKRSI